MSSDSQYFYYGNTDAFTHNGYQISVAGWFRANGVVSGEQTLISKWRSFTNETEWKLSLIDPSGVGDFRLRWAVSHGSTTTYWDEADFRLVANEWLYVYASRVNSTSFELTYGDGDVIFDSITGPLDSTTPTENTGAPLVLGGRNYATNLYTDFFDGRLDNWGFWSKYYDPSSTDLWNNGEGKLYGELSAQQQGALAGHWSFDYEVGEPPETLFEDSHTYGIHLQGYGDTEGPQSCDGYPPLKRTVGGASF